MATDEGRIEYAYGDGEAMDLKILGVSLREHNVNLPQYIKQHST